MAGGGVHVRVMRVVLMAVPDGERGAAVGTVNVDILHAVKLMNIRCKYYFQPKIRLMKLHVLLWGLYFRRSKFSLRFLLISRIHARVRAPHTLNTCILWARHSSLASKFACEFSSVRTKIKYFQRKFWHATQGPFIVSQARPISARDGRVWWTAKSCSTGMQLAGWRNQILHSWLTQRITCCRVSTLRETVLEVFLQFLQ